MTTVSLVDPCDCGNLLMLVTDGLRYTIQCDRCWKTRIVDRAEAIALIERSKGENHSSGTSEVKK